MKHLDTDRADRARTALRGKRVALAASALLAAVALPGTAQAGFLEQLFGIQPAPQAQPAPYAGPAYTYTYVPRRVAPRPAKKRVAAAEAVGSGRQTPTDLMHDRTLRAGDAVMMRDGLHVYAGGQGGVHVAADFRPLDRSALPRKERAVLAAADTMRPAPVVVAAASPALGRSVAVEGQPVVAGTVITDVRGRRLRYVGP